MISKRLPKLNQRGKQMDFELSEEQRHLQRLVQEFVRGECTKEYALDLERNHKFPWELLNKASELGLIAVDFPEEYGGGGCGLLEKVLVLEELCRVGAGIGLSVGTSQFASKLILRSGTEQQKKKYLPLVCTGEALPFSGAFTEPDRGSDLVTHPLSTTAIKEGNSYVLNGTKTFTTFASIAKYAVVLCQTDPKAQPPYRGRGVVLVEMDRSGIGISEFEKMGWHAAPATEVSFMDVRVPQENLIGEEENRGFYHSMEFLNEFRIEIAACGVGMAQGAFDRALDYARTREAFGCKIGAFQAISHKLADMATKIETARLLTYKAAWQFQREGRIQPEVSSMAKWYSARAAVEVSDEAVEILGGYGYMLENEVERFYRDARMLEMIEGTREIQKNTIARSLLREG